MTDLASIRERDRLTVARMGKPDEDPLLRAEMDRRWLLDKVDSLADAALDSVQRRVTFQTLTLRDVMEHLRHRGAVDVEVRLSGIHGPRETMPTPLTRSVLDAILDTCDDARAAGTIARVLLDAIDASA